MNKNYAVLGSPIAHSKSPAIHAAAYRVLGEDWNYSRFEVKKGALTRFIETQGSDLNGFSLTMPLKEEAFLYAQVIDESSSLTKTSNTLVRIDDQWHGFNTDIFGIVQAVGNQQVTQSLIIGSGATATSAMVAVSRIAPGSSVMVFARNSKTRKILVEFGRELGLSATVVRRLRKAITKSDLTISTLPGGAMDSTTKKIVDSRFFRPRGMLLDVAYDPWPSQLAEAWMKQNIKVVSGLEMLIWQAVAQIRIFKSGNPEAELPNEIAVVQAMRIALEQ
jgi:shikimate dehydrogenase